jgi:hypothetical protein
MYYSLSNVMRAGERLFLIFEFIEHDLSKLIFSEDKSDFGGLESPRIEFDADTIEVRSHISYDCLR